LIDHVEKREIKSDGNGTEKIDDAGVYGKPLSQDVS